MADIEDLAEAVFDIEDIVEEVADPEDLIEDFMKVLKPIYTQLFTARNIFTNIIVNTEDELSLFRCEFTVALSGEHPNVMGSN